MPPDEIALFGPSDEGQCSFPAIRRKFPDPPTKFPDNVSKFPDPLSREFRRKAAGRQGFFGCNSAPKAAEIAKIPCIFPDDQGI